MDKTILYTKDGKPFNTDNYKIIGSGKRSSIYESNFGTEVLKFYYSTTPKGQTIKESMFKEIKDIDSTVIPRLGECLYHGKRSTFFPTVRAYTMEKVQKDYIDVLTMNPGKFAIEVAGNLSIISDQLGERNILINKPKRGNVIVNGKGLHLVDPDLFTKNNKLCKYECIIENKKMALKYLKMIILECAEYRHNLGDKSDIIDQLLDFEVLSSTDLTIGVYKNLGRQPLIMKLKK